MKGNSYWRYTHFPLNHDYGRKGIFYMNTWYWWYRCRYCKTFHRRMILDISWRWDNCVILGWSLSGQKTLGHWQQPLPQCFPVDKNRYENKLDLVINYEDSLSYGSICMCKICKYIPYLEDHPRYHKWLYTPYLQAMKSGHLEGESPHLWDLRSPWSKNHLQVLGWSSK